MSARDDFLRQFGGVTQRRTKTPAEELIELLRVQDDKLAPHSSVGSSSYLLGDDIAPAVRPYADRNITVTTESAKMSLSEDDKKKQEKKQNQDGKWFKGGAFSDGYQFGDVTKTIVGTLHDANENITAAVFDATENLIDTTAYGVGMIGGLFNKDFQKDVGKFIGKEILAPTQAGEAVATYANPVGLANLLVNGGKTEENSVLGDKADGLVQSGSHLVGSYALQMVGVPAWLTQGVNAFGSEIESAFQDDATFAEAGISGGISAAAEIAFERISSGIKLGGSTLDESAQTLLKTGVKNKLSRTIAKYVVDVLAEGGEEVATEAVSAVGRKLTYMKDEEFSDIFSSEDALDAFIGGAIMSGVAGGGKIVKSAKTGRDYTSGLTTNEEKVVQKIYEDELAERKANGEKVNKTKLYDDIVKRMERGYISTDTIESILGGDEYKAYKDYTDSNKALQDELNELRGMESGKRNDFQNERLEELKKMNLDDKTKSNELKKKLTDKVSPLVKNSRLAESYNERLRAGQDFVADYDKYKGTKHEDAAKQTLDNAIKAGASNTNAVHDIVDMAAGLSADTGYVYEFKEGEQIRADFIERQTKEIAKLEAIENRTEVQNNKIARLKELVANVQSGEVKVNGNIGENGQIVLNVDSQNPLNRIIGHEVTHSTESAKHYAKLKDSLFAYAKTKGVDIDAELEMKALEYEGVKDANPEAELVADLVGDYLFTDPDYVKNLTTENRNVAQWLFDEIKYFLTKVTTGSKEERELLRVKHEFEKAFREAAEVKTRATATETTSQDGIAPVVDIKKGRSEAEKALAQKQIYEDTRRRLGHESPERQQYLSDKYNELKDRLEGVDKDDVLVDEDGNIIGTVTNKTDDGFTVVGDDIVERVLNDSFTADYIISGMEVDGWHFEKPTAETGGVSYSFGVTQEDINNYVEAAYKNENDVDYKKYAEVSDRLLNDVAKDIDLNGYAHALRDNDIRHIRNSHGENTPEKYPVTKEDMKNIPWLVENYDKVLVVKRNNGKVGLIYVKTAQDGLVYYLEQVTSRYGNEPLLINKQMIKTGIGDIPDLAGLTDAITKKQSVTEFLDDLKKAPKVYAQSVYQSHSIDRIPKTEDSVNSEFSSPEEAAEAEEISDSKVQYSLSSAGEQTDPIGGFDFYGKDLRKKPLDDIAPVTEAVSVVGEDTDVPTNDEPTSDIAPPVFTVELPIKETPKTPTKETSTDLTNKDSFITQKAAALYEEVNSMKKGVRVSPELSYLLDALDLSKENKANSYKSLRTALLNIKTQPNRMVNKNSEIEVMARALVSAAYDSAVKKETTLKYIRDLQAQREANKSKTSIEAIQAELANLKELREEAIANYERKIAEKQMELDSKKNKDTKVANNLKMQIENLKRILDSMDVEYTKRIDNLSNREQLAREGKPTTRQELHNGIIQRMKAELAKKGYDLDAILNNGKRMHGIAINDNTPQRVNDKIFGYEAGEVLNDLTFNRVALNESEGVKWLNEQIGKLREISKKYGVKPGSKESAAAQMYAEGFYVSENDELISYGKNELKKDFPQSWQNIIKLAQDPVIRQIYDDTLNAINESRTRNAYPAIPRRDNYYLHFREMNDTFSQIGIPFNPNDIKAKDLPTDINGITADLKPGQPYFSSSMQRKGKQTSFDIFGGVEKYLNSAKNQIYHIDDIQTERALWGYIAEQFGQAEGLENLDLMTPEEAADHIKKVYNGHLSNYARFLNEHANHLAGKTALMDRGVEGIIDRRGLQVLNTINSQTSKNQVGFNISSSLTNFIPTMETIARTSKQDSVKAFGQMVANIFHKDDFAENDPALIRRRGADRFAKKPWEKISDAGYVLMSTVDNIASEFIVRTKYNELVRKGMDSETAHIRAGEWAMRIMGDRSLGQMPLLYNSKTLGLITKYQLEVRNVLDSMFYDTMQESKMSAKDIENVKARNAKTAATYASKLTQIAILNHLFGTAFEAVAGYNPAFDIIGLAMTLFGLDDDEEEKDTFGENFDQFIGELADDLPYISTFTGGGRIPVADALPIGELLTNTDDNGEPIADGDWGWLTGRLQTASEAFPYYVLPGGYGQLKKTYQGLSMFDDDLPIAGSYTESGNLRFPVEDTFGNRLRAGIFGQYASANAREYFDNDWAPLKEKQIQEFADLDIPIRDYREIREDLADLDTLGEKAVYISNLDLPIDKKNLLINNIADREDPIDLAGMSEDGDFGEFEYAKKYPTKYVFLQDNGISYEEFESFDEETKEAWTWAYQNPGKYAVSKATSSGVIEFREYVNTINKFKADKDVDGDPVSGSAKDKKMAYIESLSVDYYTKIILHRMTFQSDDFYNAEIVEYVIGRDDLSFDEKTAFFEELGFNVSNGTVSW